MNTQELPIQLSCRWPVILKTVASILFLWLCAGLNLIVAATNLLTNPGFEDGITGWAGSVRGASVTVITDAAVAHSGSNYASTTGSSTGQASVNQGDILGPFPTGVSIPISDTKFYKMNAYVKVPGGSVTSQQVTLRYRWDPSGTRNDVGYVTINNENWNLVESPWLQPPPGTTFVGYWEIHSAANAITFYADDCGMVEDAFTVTGRVVDGVGAGVDGATVTATVPGYRSPSSITAGGGYYSFTVPPVAGTYAVSASKALYSPGATSVTLTTGNVTAPNITLTKLPTTVVSGKVFQMVSSSPVGVAGAVVTAQYGGASQLSAATGSDGLYSVEVPVGAQVMLSAAAGGKLNASAPGPFTPPNSTPITGKDIQVTDVPAAGSMLFSLVTENLPASGPTGNWLTFVPAGLPFVPISGTPTVQQFGGRKWEQNYRATSTRFQLRDPALTGGSYTTPITIDGATVVLAAKPTRTAAGDPWMSIVDIFYSQLCLGVRSDNGLICVKVSDTVNNNNTYTAPASTAIPDGQTTIISLVVSNTGTFVVYTNGRPIWTNTATLGGGVGFTSLTPGTLGGAGGFASYICIGGNTPDGWPIFNGYIGDVFVYTNVLADLDRQALEANLLNWFVTNATLSYTITASAGANGSISPTGAVSVLQGTSKTFTMTASPGYVVSSVLVDGVSAGAVTSYTFTNLSAPHTIAASFVALPPQTITASVTGSGGTISPIGSVIVPAGTDQAFAMIPTSGYAVSNVVVDGVSQGEIYSYTFPFVIAPHTISVSFRALSMNVPKTDQLIFSVVANVLTNIGSPTGPWPTYVPAGKTLNVQFGAPTSVIGVGGVGTTPGIGTNVWESNVRSTSDRYRYSGGTGAGGEYLSSIPCPGGATIVVVAAPSIGLSRDAWNSIVDVFYNRLTLGIRNDNGAVYARVNGTGADSTELIPSYQPTVLSMVVQPDGSYNVWANTALIMSGAGPAMTNLVPGGNVYEHYINVGGNDPDGWPSFNGNIGDVFLYRTALTSAERTQLENILVAKYNAPLPPTYMWAGPNNGSWSSPANWSNTVPSIGNTAVFSAVSSAGATVQLDTPVSIKGVQFNNVVPNTTIASTPGNTLTLDNGTTTSLISLYTEAGTHTISAAVDAPPGISKTGAGKLTLSGTVSLASVSTANPAFIVSGTGSELALASSTTLTPGKVTRVTGNGKLTITGSLTTGAADVTVGENNTSGQVVLSGTGSWTHTGQGFIVFGNDGPNCVGTLTINGSAVLDISGGTGASAFGVGVGWNGGSTGLVVQNGGTLKTAPVSTSWIYEVAPGLSLGGWSSDPCTAEYDLNGGILVTPNIYNCNNNGVTLIPPNGSAVFKFNGGVLQGTQNDNQGNANVVTEGSTNLMGNLSHAYVQAGGAKIDTATFNCGINQSLEHDPSLGTALDGGLTKLGLGTLTLYKPSTYTGPTKVQAGVLACANSPASLAAAALELDASATLDLGYSGTRTIPSLKIAGSNKGPGVYGSTTAGITGTGTVTVAAPSLPLSGFTRPGGVPTFAVPNTAVGFQYRLVYKNNLTDPTWTPIGAGTAGNNGTVTLSDTSTPPLPANRFYRLEVK